MLLSISGNKFIYKCKLGFIHRYQKEGLKYLLVLQTSSPITHQNQMGVLFIRVTAKTQLQILPPQPMDTPQISQTLSITASSKHIIAQAYSIAVSLEGFASVQSLYNDDILIHFFTYESARNAANILRTKIPSLLISFYSVPDFLNCTMPYYHTFEYQPVQFSYASQQYTNYEMNQEYHND